MMMAADGHAVAQFAEPQRGFKIGHALVSVCGIVAVAADGRRGFVTARTMGVHTLVGNLLAAVDQRRHAAADGIRDQAGSCNARGHSSSPVAVWSRAIPICLARATSFNARCTTGASIILEPRLTTPRRRACASS